MTPDELREELIFIMGVCTTYNLEPPESHTQLGIGRWLSKGSNFAFYTRAIKKASQKSYYYMGTFTIAPAKKHLFAEAKDYIVQMVSRSALHLEQFAYVQEQHKNGDPHFHVAVKSSKPIKKNRFAYYTKKFGFVDWSRSQCDSMHESLAYMSKEGEPIILL